MGRKRTARAKCAFCEERRPVNAPGLFCSAACRNRWRGLFARPTPKATNQGGDPAWRRPSARFRRGISPETTRCPRLAPQSVIPCGGLLDARSPGFLHCAFCGTYWPIHGAPLPLFDDA